MPRRAGAGRKPGLTPNGPEIKRRRVELGLSTAQLAERVGLHAESIRRAQKGGPIGDVFASRLARALGTTVEDIISDGDESEPETTGRLSA